jgi:hypothetical protein
MPSGYWKLVEIAEQRRIEGERMQAEQPPSNVGAIYALVGLGCLALLTAFFLERM